MFIVLTADGVAPQRLLLQKEQLDIGRDPGADIVLSDPNVSSRHARLFVRDGKVIIRDLGSTNGTTINGRPLQRPMLLRAVDLVRSQTLDRWHWAEVPMMGHHSQLDRPAEGKVAVMIGLVDHVDEGWPLLTSGGQLAMAGGTAAGEHRFPRDVG